MSVRSQAGQPPRDSGFGEGCSAGQEYCKPAALTAMDRSGGTSARDHAEVSKPGALSSTQGGAEPLAFALPRLLPCEPGARKARRDKLHSRRYGALVRLGSCLTSMTSNEQVDGHGLMAMRISVRMPQQLLQGCKNLSTAE